MPKDIKDQLDFLPPSPEGYDEVPRERHPVCNRHMFVQALATVVAVFVVVANTTVVAAAEVELVVSVELAGAGEPVAEAEARIALEVSVVVGRIIGARRVVGSKCDIAEVIDEWEGTSENLILELAVSVDPALHSCNKTLHLDLHLASWPALKGHSPSEVERGHSW